MAELNDDQSDVLIQFEMLVGLANENVTKTALFQESLNIYNELIRLRQALSIKEMSLRQESFLLH